MAAEDFDVD